MPGRIAVLCVALFSVPAGAAEPVVIRTPLSPPEWALLQQQLLKANTAACLEFYDRYFDDRGWLECVERWGGDDGPDDAIENLKDWPILHALGAPDVILERSRRAWEGHLRQYTLAKTRDVPMARDGMYYKEFPVSFDWLHNGEGLCVFNLQGLSDPDEARFRQRVKRFAGFYLNDDPQAPNYDARHKLIRSFFNGSRGPTLRPATALDWAGDPIEIEGRFKPRHGERNYTEMLAHFKDYTDIVGDHPQNLQSTNLAMNAFLLDGEPRYRDWVLEYVGAWRERMIANGNVIPTKVDLEGRIGGAEGKWWGGVYGWGFTVIDPVTQKPVHRNRHHAGFQGFMNAYLLTGDDAWLAPWREQFQVVNDQQRMSDGVAHYPHMHGKDGWYEFRREKYSQNALELWWLSQKAEDRTAVPELPWVEWLERKAPEWPVTSLRADLDRVRRQVQAIRDDASTPDTRLADDSMGLNPASIGSLIQQQLGGLPPGNTGALLFCRLRYFDPLHRRAGLPEGVSALIEQMSATETRVTLVNTDVTAAKTFAIQAGGYAENAFTSVSVDGEARKIQGSSVSVRLEPGCGATLTLAMKRFSRLPTLRFPE
jgi:hypothetical protein